MPDPDYNESLREFDLALLHELESDGMVVLVETFAGQRMYYAYVRDEVDSRDRATQVLAKYGHLSESSFRGGADPHWRFFDQYIEKFEINIDD